MQTAENYIHGQWVKDYEAHRRGDSIDPATGEVTGWIDLAGILPAMDKTGSEDVMNGIAYDAARDRLFVTGKLWSRLYEIRLKQRS